MKKVVVGEAVGVALAAYADTFKDAVALELVKNKFGLEETRGLGLVGDDAADKVRVGGV